MNPTHRIVDGITLGATPNDTTVQLMDKDSSLTVDAAQVRALKLHAGGARTTPARPAPVVTLGAVSSTTKEDAVAIHHALGLPIADSILVALRCRTADAPVAEFVAAADRYRMQGRTDFVDDAIELVGKGAA